MFPSPLARLGFDLNAKNHVSHVTVTPGAPSAVACVSGRSDNLYDGAAFRAMAAQGMRFRVMIPNVAATRVWLWDAATQCGTAAGSMAE